MEDLQTAKTPLWLELKRPLRRNDARVRLIRKRAKAKQLEIRRKVKTGRALRSRKGQH